MTAQACKRHQDFGSGSLRPRIGHEIHDKRDDETIVMEVNYEHLTKHSKVQRGRWPRAIRHEHITKPRAINPNSA